MNKTITFASCIVLAVMSLSTSGCGDSANSTVIGGPTPEIQAQIDARSQDFSKSMGESMKSDPSNKSN